MSLKNQWLVNSTIVLLSWLSLTSYGWRNIKRFFPASILVVLLEALNVQIGKRRKWWIFYNKPNSYLTGEFPLNIGPFFITAMWTLKWSYGNLSKFLLINAMINAGYAIVFTWFLEKLKVVQLIRINKFQYFLYLFYKAFFLYAFQYLLENKKKFN